MVHPHLYKRSFVKFTSIEFWRCLLHSASADISLPKMSNLSDFIVRNLLGEFKQVTKKKITEFLANNIDVSERHQIFWMFYEVLISRENSDFFLFMTLLKMQRFSFIHFLLFINFKLYRFHLVSQSHKYYWCGGWTGKYISSLIGNSFPLLLFSSWSSNLSVLVLYSYFDVFIYHSFIEFLSSCHIASTANMAWLSND